MGYGRRLALSEALKTDKKVIAWTEPEKVTYLPDLAKTILPILENSADLVIPKRKSLDSYPIFPTASGKIWYCFLERINEYGLGFMVWSENLA